MERLIQSLNVWGEIPGLITAGLAMLAGAGEALMVWGANPGAVNATFVQLCLVAWIFDPCPRRVMAVSAALYLWQTML